MVKQFVFNFKLDADDRRRLLALSRNLQRTQADTVRWLIRQATNGLRQQASEPAIAPLSLTDPIAIIGDWEEWEEWVGAGPDDEVGQ